MAEYVRFGIIGTGVGANFCAEGLSMITDAKVAKLVAVTSRREERAKEFASKWNLDLWYTNYEEMLEKAPIDAVIINTPHYLHYPMALDAVRAGKHTLVDKPMTINLREADDLIKEAKKKDVKLGVILQSRFDPTIRKVKDAADEGKFGRLILGEASVKWFRTQEYYEKSPWRGRWATEGGGALINQAIHTIDLLLWIMGRPKYLWAQIDTVAHNIEVEDLAVAAIRFENDALGIIQGSTAAYPGLPTRLEIHGTKGTATIEGEILKRWSVLGEEEVVVEKTKEGLKSWARPELVPATNHAALIRDFAEAILNDREPFVDGAEGRRSLEVIMAIYESGRSRSVIDFPIE
ncbi:gfo/Idh/MocA family oxidoreductase [Candidatus Bathyarchaeota archaeon]|nr:MAG: gfo/Idh/MocA family oxidoreductase [Candidatus Bathyarchaeota archaeon]